MVSRRSAAMSNKHYKRNPTVPVVLPVESSPWRDASDPAVWFVEAIAFLQWVEIPRLAEVCSEWKTAMKGFFSHNLMGVSAPHLRVLPRMTFGQTMATLGWVLQLNRPTTPHFPLVSMQQLHLGPYDEQHEYNRQALFHMRGLVNVKEIDIHIDGIIPVGADDDAYLRSIPFPWTSVRSIRMSCRTMATGENCMYRMLRRAVASDVRMVSLVMHRDTPTSYAPMGTSRDRCSPLIYPQDCPTAPSWTSMVMADGSPSLLPFQRFNMEMAMTPTASVALPHLRVLSSACVNHHLASRLDTPAVRFLHGSCRLLQIHAEYSSDIELPTLRRKLSSAVYEDDTPLQDMSILWETDGTVIVGYYVGSESSLVSILTKVCNMEADPAEQPDLPDGAEPTTQSVWLDLDAETVRLTVSETDEIETYNDPVMHDLDLTLENGHFWIAVNRPQVYGLAIRGSYSYWYDLLARVSVDENECPFDNLRILLLETQTDFRPSVWTKDLQTTRFVHPFLTSLSYGFESRFRNLDTLVLDSRPLYFYFLRQARRHRFIPGPERWPEMETEFSSVMSHIDDLLIQLVAFDHCPLQEIHVFCSDQVASRSNQRHRGCFAMQCANRKWKVYIHDHPVSLYHLYCDRQDPDLLEMEELRCTPDLDQRLPSPCKEVPVHTGYRFATGLTHDLALSIMADHWTIDFVGGLNQCLVQPVVDGPFSAARLDSDEEEQDEEAIPLDATFVLRMPQ